MKRWNGWGTTEIDYHVPAAALTYLADRVGPAQAAPSVAQTDVLAAVPPGRLPAHPLVSADAMARLTHARGQSLPDWVALRFGRIDRFPDGVAFPADEAAIQALLDFARQNGVTLIPYGGGSSVVGARQPASRRRSAGVDNGFGRHDSSAWI